MDSIRFALETMNNYLPILFLIKTVTTDGCWLERRVRLGNFYLIDIYETYCCPLYDQFVSTIFVC